MTAVAVPARGEQWVAGSRAVNMLACEEAAHQTNSSHNPAFRSKAVAPESPTPYTDATQVRIIIHSNPRRLARYIICLCYGHTEKLKGKS